ncbi:MAG: DUF4037 domain-containing protein [Firmicutes bacterium]|nr:DUF4037 domain-containing protein [Bacillota bacterium]
MNGLGLSRAYFLTVAAPAFDAAFPALTSRMAAGLVGNGSECFGYDDEISMDHDWGIDFFIWLAGQDRESIEPVRQWKRELFAQHPPPYPRTQSAYGASIGVMTAGDFYTQLIGYPEGPQTIPQWRLVPEENLAMSVNGAVFTDRGGEFSHTRSYLLQYYPEDLRKKKLAAKCMAIAQTGQYNFNRCVRRQDWVTVRTVLARFTDNVISMVFLLNKVFRPYYKWAFRRLAELPILGAPCAELLRRMALTGGFDSQSVAALESAIGEICAAMIKELQNQRLASSDDWFMTTQGEEIQRTIADDWLRSLPAQYE